MSPYFIIVDGKVVDLHFCAHCGERIRAAGICAPCAFKVAYVAQVTKVEIPIKRIINPEDLRD